MKNSARKDRILHRFVELFIVGVLTFTFIQTCSYLRKPEPIKPKQVCEENVPCRAPYTWEW